MPRCFCPARTSVVRAGSSVKDERVLRRAWRGRIVCAILAKRIRRREREGALACCTNSISVALHGCICPIDRRYQPHAAARQDAGPNWYSHAFPSAHRSCRSFACFVFSRPVGALRAFYPIRLSASASRKNSGWRHEPSRRSSSLSPSTIVMAVSEPARFTALWISLAS